MKKLITIIFVTVFSSFANASSGECDATLYKIWLEKIGQDEFVRQKKIDSKKFEVNIPKEDDPITSYYLDGEIGQFKISAMFEHAEESISNLTISDASHSMDTFGDRFTSLSDLKNMKKVSVSCQYVK